MSDVTADRVPPPFRWDGDQLLVLDQRKLPAREYWLCCRSAEDVAEAIKGLAVRGAPSIGIAAAFGLVLATRNSAEEHAQLVRNFDYASRLLLATRPTAVNLRWAIEWGRRVFEEALRDEPTGVRGAMLAWAERLIVDQTEIDRRLATHGVSLLASGDRVLTHCHTGRLATGGLGTAGGLLQVAYQAGRLAKVWVDETRPLLQGARLTAWELGLAGVPYTLVTDSSVGLLMAQGLVDRVVVGADRIAANGDVANKIGTYTVALLAWHHDIPLYVAAPCSTLDPHTERGSAIVLEERDPEEVKAFGGATITPADAPALNMAFDITPNELVSAIVTEAGTLQAPYDRSIAWALAQPPVASITKCESPERPAPRIVDLVRSAETADDRSRQHRAPSAQRHPRVQRTDRGDEEPARPRFVVTASQPHAVLEPAAEPTHVDAELVEGLSKMGRLFYVRGWLPGTGGNFSAVVEQAPFRLAITASGVDKWRLSSTDLLVVDAHATVLCGTGRPSNELLVHLAILEARQGATVIVHTHSVWSTLASLNHDRGVELTGYEQLKGLAGVRSPEHREWLAILENDQAIDSLAQSAAETLREWPASHGLLVRGHGLYTWGTSLAEAQRHVETLEFLLEVHVRRTNNSNGGTS